MRRLLAVVVVILMGSASAWADTLEKTTGQKLEGRVIAETPETVTFEVVSGGISFTQKVPRAQIRKLEKEAREGPGYCAIPLVGEVGVEITAKALGQALAEARRFKPQYIILVIDSNGGLISERDKVVNLLRENQDLQIIAYVKKAYSAAATIALACPKLYVAPEGAIGAAVGYRITPNGAPELLEEKYASAVRAKDREASALGKRSELYLRGMSEGDLELSVFPAEKGPTIVEGNPEGSTLIKRKGQILTANAREAVDWGMANAIVASVDALKEPLDLKAWHHEDKRPWQMMAESSRLARQHVKEADEAFVRMARRAAYINKLGPELSNLQSRLEKARATVVAEEQALRELKELLEADVKETEETYSGNGTMAQKNKQRQLAYLRNKYEPQILSHKKARDEALAEAIQIEKRLKVYLAGLPPE